MDRNGNLTTLDKARKPASGGAGQKNKYSVLGVVLLNK